MQGRLAEGNSAGHAAGGDAKRGPVNHRQVHLNARARPLAGAGELLRRHRAEDQPVVVVARARAGGGAVLAAGVGEEEDGLRPREAQAVAVGGEVAAEKLHRGAGGSEGACDEEALHLELGVGQHADVEAAPGVFLVVAVCEFLDEVAGGGGVERAGDDDVVARARGKAAVALAVGAEEGQDHVDLGEEELDTHHDDDDAGDLAHEAHRREVAVADR